MYYTVRKSSSSCAAAFKDRRESLKTCVKNWQKKGVVNSQGPSALGSYPHFVPFLYLSLNSPGRIKTRAGHWPLLPYISSDQVTDTSGEYELTGLDNNIPGSGK